MCCEMAAASFPRSVVDRLQHPAAFDAEAMVCPFGLIAVYFFFVKFLLERPDPDVALAKVPVGSP